MSSIKPHVWRMLSKVNKLIGSKCRKCGAINFPPRQICTKCGSFELDDYRMSRRGRVITYVIAHRMPEGVPAPIAYGVIQTDDGAKISCWSTDCDPYEIKVGMPVELVFRIVSSTPGEPIFYGMKFRPFEGT